MLKKTLATALVTLLPVMAAAESHSMAGDAEAGEKVFRKCKACHQVGEGAENKTGPALNGVVGRVIGGHEDFKYSKTLQEMGEAGDTWTPEHLDAFLKKPKDFAKGTKMAFAGLRKDEDRADVIAYLATFEE
ncbi:c-type cytochrome [Sagittula salina]|uniref:Cytochrome c family protein n=1 Tax=Sagittula salina TaxID=2820268 RepID=A0A940MMP2_9RHOB|nr:cytochrome c family protein [Sagittula salina]MBP0484705.1 cytochrome c family protein [Sagittula salina]